MLNFFSTFLFSQPNLNIRVDTVRWKDGGYTLDTYLRDTLINRRSFFKDSTQEQINGDFRGPSGYRKIWNKNGNLNFEGIQYNNEYIDLFIIWNEKGQRVTVYEFNEEDTIVKATYYEYYETGVLKSIKKYKGKTFNLVKDSFGVKQKVYNYKEDLTKTGIWIYFSEFGEIIERKKYK